MVRIVLLSVLLTLTVVLRAGKLRHAAPPAKPAAASSGETLAVGRASSPAEPATPAPKTVRVAAIQCYSRMGKIAYNREMLSGLIARAAAMEARILVLPECAVHGYMDPGRGRGWSCRIDSAAGADESGELPVGAVAETIPGPSTRYFAGLARKHGVYLALPLIESGAGGGFHNSLVLLAPSGKIAAHHRKQALWPPGDSRWATAGERKAQTIATPYGRLGLMICFDVHEVPPQLKAERADIVLYAVGWYGPNTENWFGDIFPRRYVVPNGFAVVAANWSGEEGGAEWPGQGHSCIIGRDGTVLARAARTKGTEIVIADLPLPQSALSDSTAGAEIEIDPEDE